MRKSNRVEVPARKAADDRLQLTAKPGASDERLTELVRVLARCAAQRYIADSEEERACGGS